MLARCIIMFALLALQLPLADAGDESLTHADVEKIMHVCSQAVGYTVAKDYDLWNQLTPFLRSKGELDHLTVDCSSQHCSGSIRLRDDAEILYDYFHVPPEHSNIGPSDLTPDIEYKGNNRFVGAALVRHGKLVFRRGDLKEWFLKQHLRN